MKIFKQILKRKSDPNTHQNALSKIISRGGGGGHAPEPPSTFGKKILPPPPGKSWLHSCTILHTRSTYTNVYRHEASDNVDVTGYHITSVMQGHIVPMNDAYKIQDKIQDTKLDLNSVW